MPDRRSPGAGPRSTIASTIARNAPERARRASRRHHVAADGQSEKSKHELDRVPVGRRGGHARIGDRRAEHGDLGGQMSPLRPDTTLRSSAGHLTATLCGLRLGHWTFVRYGVLFLEDYDWLGEGAPRTAGRTGRSTACCRRTRSMSSATAWASLRWPYSCTTAPGRRADRGVLRRGQVPARAGRSGADRALRPGRAAPEPAGALRHRGAGVRRARVDRPRQLRPRRSCSCSGLVDGALAITGRALTRGAVGRGAPAGGAAEGGQRADEHRLRGRLGRRRGARPAS